MRNSVIQTDYEVGIIGGGPAGASLACYLARAGIRVAVFEKELFPRPHVGESLVPSSTRVFRELDFLDQMESHGFPRKYGAVWTSTRSTAVYHHDWKDLEDVADIRFDEREQVGVSQDYTYHVDRGQFDLLLLQHANRSGAAVYQGISITRVDFLDTHANLCFTMGRSECRVSAKLVVDASGRNTLLANQMNTKVNDSFFNQYALHTWFEGYDRASSGKLGLEDHIHVHFLPITSSWVWQIPITERVTSIGVVTQRKHFRASHGEPEKFFWECLGSRPGLCEGLRRARQLRPIKAEGDYSYAVRQICGDRFILIGDAARFVDPIFSTGVSIALNSARFASHDILRALETGDFSRKAFQQFESTIRRGTNHWYNFIALYYRLNVVFTHFILNPSTRLDVLKLLQGDVYDEQEPDVMRQMWQMVSEVENNENHPWRHLLGELKPDVLLQSNQAP